MQTAPIQLYMLFEQCSNKACFKTPLALNMTLACEVVYELVSLLALKELRAKIILYACQKNTTCCIMLLHFDYVYTFVWYHVDIYTSNHSIPISTHRSMQMDAFAIRQIRFSHQKRDPLCNCRLHAITIVWIYLDHFTLRQHNLLQPWAEREPWKNV